LAAGRRPQTIAKTFRLTKVSVDEFASSGTADGGMRLKTDFPSGSPGMGIQAALPIPLPAVLLCQTPFYEDVCLFGGCRE